MIITRAHLDAATRLAAAEERVKVLEEERQRLLAEIAALQAERTLILKTVVDMKREGFEPLVAVSLPAPEPPKKLPDSVQRAVDARADPGTPLHRDLTEDAWRMLDREELPAEEVVRITLGGIAATRERPWEET